MGRPGLSRHPKFLLLARTLGDENLARGVLEHGWEVAYEAGDDRLGNPDAVEAACRWRGERGVCFAALRDAGGAPGRVGFIEEREGVWCVHDLYDHAPDYVRKRAAREEQRRVKGRSLAAERRTLTGQSPGSDQALTPPRAPAPTRAPAPKEEDLPRAPPAVPRVKKDTTQKKHDGDPREGGDATYRAMVDGMFKMFHAARGFALEPSGKDWKALGRLRERHEAAEIIRRWKHGLAAQFKAKCSCFADLEAKWNDCGAPEASGAKVVKAAGATGGGEVVEFPEWPEVKDG